MPRKKRPARSAWDTALDLLARRAHTRMELQNKLRERKYDAADIDDTLERAVSLKLMESDDAIAERYAKSLTERRDATPKWALQKLLSRGIESGLAGRAVDAAFEDWDAQAAALFVVKSEHRADRAARKLERKGFSSDVIMWVVRRIEAQQT